jgi:hypothetical protein
MLERPFRENGPAGRWPVGHRFCVPYFVVALSPNFGSCNSLPHYAPALRE